jgi:2-(1,2-epoxy-1,2-dihydrophenyl)acetyl-CoA isomerase
LIEMSEFRDLVTLEQVGRTGFITFRRPQALNALTPQMIATLGDLIEDAEQRPEIRCVVFRGEGRAFTAGGDLDYLRDAGDRPAAADAAIRDLNVAITRLITLSKPTIASLHGVVAGVGLSLALACDIAVAAESTRFVYAYDKIATTPDGGLSFLLPLSTGLRVAHAIAFLGDPFSASDAREFGVVSKIVADTDLVTETDALAGRLASNDARALVRTRSLFRGRQDAAFATQLDREREEFVESVSTEAFAKALDAFYSARSAKRQATSERSI